MATYKPYRKVSSTEKEEIRIPYSVLVDTPNMSEYTKRASDETIKQLMTAYKKADTPKTYEYCLQFDEETAQKMLGQLKLESEMMKAKSVQAELEDFFRQSFIDEDNEKRKKAEYNK